MTNQLKGSQALMLYGAGLILAIAGLYYDRVIMTIGIFILFITSILLTMVKED